MKCTNCQQEQNAPVLLLNDRALCPECVLKADDKESIIEQLKRDPSIQAILYQRYPLIPEQDHPKVCYSCKTLVDLGIAINNFTYCIPCFVRYKPEEMKAIMKVLG